MRRAPKPWPDGAPWARGTICSGTRLVAAQICASLVLLTGASLLLRSLWNLQNQPLGMRTDSVLTAYGHAGPEILCRTRRANWPSSKNWSGACSRIPGVTHLALSDSMPLSGTARSTIYSVIDVAGRRARPKGPAAWSPGAPSRPAILRRWASPSCAGADSRKKTAIPHQNAIILSDSLARRMFPGEDPLGKQIQPGHFTRPWLTVIGVAGNVKNSALMERDDPEFYVVRKHSPEQLGRTATAILSGPDRSRGAWRAGCAPRLRRSIPLCP